MTSRNGPGRPREFDGDLLLDTSVDLLWEHGVSGTTTRVLQDRLGVSQSTLYNTYGSKDQLVDHALDRYEDRLEANVVSHLDRRSRGALVAFVEAVVGWVSHDRRRGCLVMNAAGESAEHQARLHSYRKRLRRRIAPCVRDFTPDEALVRARTDLVVAAVIGMNGTASSGASRAELRRMANGIVAQIEAW